MMNYAKATPERRRQIHHANLVFTYFLDKYDYETAIMYRKEFQEDDYPSANNYIARIEKGVEREKSI